MTHRGSNDKAAKSRNNSARHEPFFGKNAHKLRQLIGIFDGELFSYASGNGEKNGEKKNTKKTNNFSLFEMSAPSPSLFT